MQVQKGQWNKNCGTKIVEQKLVGTLGHWVMGTPSASAKRSVEQNLWNKNCRTKIGKCKCKKVSGTKIAEQKLRNKNSGTKIVEQKLWNKNCGTKIGGDSRPLGDGDSKGKCKRFSRTKIVEQNYSGTKFWHFGYFSKEPI